ncbi:uncharacterized protein [Procambarus clarkii]|uniref:uncharacterized protein n=1 Tax=Procambarus clarkii TaxID=6728 RepID=UPI0037437234
MVVGEAVRLTALGGPSYALEGQNVTLTCGFDLEGDDLYSLLWWLDSSVVLRYTAPLYEPSNWTSEGTQEPELRDDLFLLDPISNVTTRPLSWFPAEGLQATLGREGEPENLWLLEVGPEAAGVYTCEVTTEAPPTFLSANASHLLHVIVPPSGSPSLRGTAGVVAEGEWVAATCVSPPALPAPDITFYINQKPVVKEFMSAVMVRSTGDKRKVVSRTVGFSAYRPLFTLGHLALECRVTIDTLVWSATTDLLLEGYDPAHDAAQFRCKKLT